MTATARQYVNRLTEFYDEPYFSEAMRYFIQLTEAGVDKDHAFALVTRRVYSND